MNAYETTLVYPRPSAFICGQWIYRCRFNRKLFVTTLTELMLATFMGNLEPAVNPRARGLPKESPSRIAKLESTVNAAGEATPSTGTPAGAGQLYFKKLLSRLSAASEDCIRGLGTIQCDYRLMGAYGSEEPPTGKKPPPVKLAVSGKLTIQLPEDRADSEEPPGSFRTFRFEPDAWPMLTDGVGEAEAKELKPFSRPGSKLICSEAEAGSWLVSKDDKTAVRFKMSVGENPLFGEIAPTVCCHYQAPMIMVFRADIRGAISTKGESVSLAGHKCAKHLFELPATGAGAPAVTYTVWLDDATGLPLKEELTGGIERGTTTVTYSDFQPFRKKSFSPAKSEETEPKEDVHCEIEYSPFGTQWFLTKEISVRSSEGEVCKMTFSNWRQVTVPDSAFKLPPGAKVISSEDAPDKGSNSKQ